MGRLTRNAAILLANNIGSAGLAFVLSAVIGRGLGVEGLGQYSFIMAWIAPIVAFADFGMGSLITRDVAQNPGMAAPLLRTTTKALLPIAGIALALAWVAIPTIQLAPTVAAALAVVAVLIILDPWYGLYTALFRAFQKMEPILVINVGGLGLQVLLCIVAILGGWGLAGVAVVVAAINILQLAVTWLWWRASRPEPDPTCEVPGVRQLLRRALPFAIAGVLTTLQLRLNVLLLEQRAGDTAVGLYSAASRFVEAGRLIPGAYFGALFPALSSLVNQPAALRQTMRRALRMIMAFALLFSIGMTLFGGLLIHIAYDSGRNTFASAVPVLTVLSWSLVPALLRSVLTLYLYSQGREHFVNSVTIAVLVVQFLIGWLAIGQWGAIGAAVTVAVVEMGGAVCLWIGSSARWRSLA